LEPPFARVWWRLGLYEGLGVKEEGGGVGVVAVVEVEDAKVEIVVEDSEGVEDVNDSE
jgi:hypothetical protein